MMLSNTACHWDICFRKICDDTSCFKGHLLRKPTNDTSYLEKKIQIALTNWFILPGTSTARCLPSKKTEAGSFLNQASCVSAVLNFEGVGEKLMTLTHIEPENWSKPKGKGSSLPNINFQVRSFREGMLNPDFLVLHKMDGWKTTSFPFGARSLLRGELLNFGGVNRRVSQGIIGDAPADAPRNVEHQLPRLPKPETK